VNGNERSQGPVLVAFFFTMALPLIIKHIDRTKFHLFGELRSVHAFKLWGQTFWGHPMLWDNMRRGIRRGITKELKHG